VSQAFVDFLYTKEAQEAFALTGLRPVDEDVLAAFSDKYPLPKGTLFSIADFGGWSAAGPEFFAERTGVYSRIEADVAGAR
jgi:sulfate transport system substrate-binding protein